MTWSKNNTQLGESLYGYYDCRYKDVKLTVEREDDIEKTMLVLEVISSSSVYGEVLSESKYRLYIRQISHEHLKT